MALTGVDPFDPTPSIRRELIFGAGLSSTGPSRPVLLWGNITAAGTETANELSTPIADDVDARARLGLRSELYAMYRQYTAVDPGADISVLAFPESAGAAAACDLVVATPSTGAATIAVTIHGSVVNIPIANGDAINDIASAIADAINDADSGMLQVTATVAAATVTVVCAQRGNRGDFIIGDAGGTFGVRAQVNGTTATTVTKGNVVPGGADDDDTAAVLVAANAEFFYHVVPFCNRQAAGGGSPGSGTNIDDNDGQLGELQNMVITQSLPINGKSQTIIAANSHSQALFTPVGNALNSVYTSVFHAEHNDMTPAMLAAHHAAVVRSQQIAHPSANFAGYHSTDNTVYSVQSPFTVTDRPTATEIRADLNNGGSPIEFSPTGAASLARHVTTHSEISSGIKDYRARSGHIPSAVLFAWEIVKQRWTATKQDFIADDPVEGQPPTQNTTTPLHVRALLFSVIDDLAASNPLGVYNGPILAPDKVVAMKKSAVVSKVTAGISASVDFYAVEHLYKSEFTLRETSAAY